MRSFIILILLLSLAIPSVATHRYIVYFADKGNTSEAGFDIKDVLSPEAIANRKKNGIGFDRYDIPVNKQYLQTLEANSVAILSTSRWLNAAMVETELAPEQLHRSLPAIARITKVRSIPATANKFNLPSEKAPHNPSPQKTTGRYAYGDAYSQNMLYNIAHLHDQGYTGLGITITFLDAGFSKMDTNPAFTNTFSNNRVKATKDFVNNNPSVYGTDSHGANCASLVIGYKPANFIGMAPDVNVMFAITDDIASETHADEYNYIAAVEWAESIGTEIISVSLTYKIFDPGIGDYQYADMDGKTTISSQGARIAAAKGIILVNSADNSGFIGTPCDVDSILCVGGANMSKDYDNFSAQGPSADGRIKPDVAGATIGIYYIDPNSDIRTYAYGGTSSSTPQIAGLAACLKQKYPYAANYQIIKAIQQSAHQYTTPDARTGYGVPSAGKADTIIGNMLLSVKETPAQQQAVSIYPNPASNILYLEAKENITQAQVSNMVGRVVLSATPDAPVSSFNLQQLPSGMYIINVSLANNTRQSLKFYKQ
jgi:serine protease AprX